MFVLLFTLARFIVSNVSHVSRVLLRAHFFFIPFCHDIDEFVVRYRKMSERQFVDKTKTNGKKCSVFLFYWLTLDALTLRLCVPIIIPVYNTCAIDRIESFTLAMAIDIAIMRSLVHYTSNRWNVHNLFPIRTFIHLIIFALPSLLVFHRAKPI